MTRAALGAMARNHRYRVCMFGFFRCAKTKSSHAHLPQCLAQYVTIFNIAYQRRALRRRRHR